MKTIRSLQTLVLSLALVFGGFSAPGVLRAQEKAAAKPAEPVAVQGEAAAPAEAKKDFIMPHVLNGRELAIPSFGHGLEREIELPSWPPVHIGPLTLDLSPTKHVVMLLLGATLCAVVLVSAGRGAARARAEGRPARGFTGAIEAMVLYLRNDVILPNVGHHGEAFVPYCLTAFFMILFANLLGLFPYMATATGNISVTAVLATLSFLVIEIAGMRALGKGYINTIIYWPHDLPFAVKAPVSLIMTPVEILSKFTKPFALAMRLFANMTAGHIAVLALIGMIFTFAQLLNYSPASYGAAAIPVALATAIMALELFVAFLQAFIFMLLTAVFIGQIRESHH
jgi:F-type H+-transporting ATPase subunit a